MAPAGLLYTCIKNLIPPAGSKMAPPTLLCSAHSALPLLPGLIVFSDAKPASEASDGMLWMDDKGMSVSVLVNHVDSVSLVQLSRYRGSRASVLLPPQPIARPRGDSAPLGWPAAAERWWEG